jgi:hypothetical protein
MFCRAPYNTLAPADTSEKSAVCMPICSDGGVMVTYGGMSKQPVMVPYEALAYKVMLCDGRHAYSQALH